MSNLAPNKPDTASELESVADALASGVYVNPFAHAPGLVAGRVDQGQDFATTQPSRGAPVDAIGAGRITAIDPNFYKGEPAIYETLTSGPLKGEETYYAEQLTPDVTVGEEVNKGQQIATIARTGTGLELGWASENLPAARGEFTGGETALGKNFASFLDATKHENEGQALIGILKGLPPQGGERPLAGVAEGINEAGKTVSGLPGELAGAVAKTLFGWVEEAFGALFVKALLYAVLAGGGVALIIAAFGHATGTQPYRAAAGAAKRGLAAGAAA
jgi:hypothetical protein